MTSSATQFDVVIIGGGHNGLTAAAYLAKKGKRVCVLEQSNTLGGMAQIRKDDDGITTPRMAHLAYNLNPTVLKELGIASKIPLTKVPTIHLSPDGKHIEVSDDGARYLDGTAHSESEIYATLRNRIARFAKLLAPMALRSPPNLSGGFNLAMLGEATAMAKLGLNMRGMGKSEMREFLRIVLSNVYDVILDDLADGPLAGGLAADALWGTWSGPRSPGTVFSMMYRYGVSATTQAPTKGMGSIIDALEDCARKNGADIKLGAKAKSVVVEDDAIKAIALENGETINTKAVMSSIGPFATMMMAGVDHYDTEAVRRIRHVRSKGMNAKVNLVLKKAPQFTGLNPEHLKSRLVVCPSVQYAETAFNSAKYGEMPPSPVLEIVSPSTIESSSSGAVTLSVVAQYIPALLKGGWNDIANRSLSETVVNTLATYAPTLRDDIVRIESLSPADIEKETGAPGGHWHHCELSTDQLLAVRPVNGLSQYAFGVKGFYLCGASAHPGGDVSGAAGRNSALQILKDGVLA